MPIIPPVVLYQGVGSAVAPGAGVVAWHTGSVGKSAHLASLKKSIAPRNEICWFNMVSSRSGQHRVEEGAGGDDAEPDGDHPARGLVPLWRWRGDARRRDLRTKTAPEGAQGARCSRRHRRAGVDDSLGAL